jgi:hypothetical protein
MYTDRALSQAGSCLPFCKRKGRVNKEEAFATGFNSKKKQRRRKIYRIFFLARAHLSAVGGGWSGFLRVGTFFLEVRSGKRAAFMVGLNTVDEAWCGVARRVRRRAVLVKPIHPTPLNFKASFLIHRQGQ